MNIVSPLAKTVTLVCGSFRRLNIARNLLSNVSAAMTQGGVIFLCWQVFTQPVIRQEVLFCCLIAQR